MNTQHVCTLETAKRRKELGLPQESEFYWVKQKEGWILVDKGMRERMNGLAIMKKFIVEWFSAPLSSETLDRLPKRLINEKEHPVWYLTVHCNEEYHAITYETFNGNGTLEFTQTHKSLAECACLIEIYLKEKGLI